MVACADLSPMNNTRRTTAIDAFFMLVAPMSEMWQMDDGDMANGGMLRRESETARV